MRKMFLAAVRYFDAVVGHGFGLAVGLLPDADSG
jgi:hypothetical protein